jgi:DnaJ domain
MVSTLRSLSNHYETLRIKPTASNEEISEAFSRQIRNARVRPDITVAQLAQISVAYETLRDSIRRRAYDASLGLNQAPKQDAPPPLTAEPRVATFIATSLREPAKPRETATRPQPDPVPQWPVPRGAAAAAPAADPPPRAEVAPKQRVELVLEPREERGRISIDRKQATIGAGFAGFVILALGLAWPQKQATAPELATAAPHAQAVTIGLPPATQAQDQSALPVQVPAAMAAATAQPLAATPGTETPPLPESDHALATETTGDQAAAQPAPAEAAPEQAAAVETPADATADSTPAATPAAAKLPLPEATIARTIERIGYACGSIVSSSTVSAGVFKIVCSSGDAYQAAPVGGRYRFHRWGSH